MHALGARSNPRAISSKILSGCHRISGGTDVHCHDKQVFEGCHGIVFPGGNPREVAVRGSLVNVVRGRLSDDAFGEIRLVIQVAQRPAREFQVLRHARGIVAAVVKSCKRLADLFRLTA